VSAPEERGPGGEAEPCGQGSEPQPAQPPRSRGAARHRAETEPRGDRTPPARPSTQTPPEHLRSDADELGLQVRSSTCRERAALSPAAGGTLLPPAPQPAPRSPCCPHPTGTRTRPRLWLCPAGTMAGASSCPSAVPGAALRRGSHAATRKVNDYLSR